MQYHRVITGVALVLLGACTEQAPILGDRGPSNDKDARAMMNFPSATASTAANPPATPTVNILSDYQSLPLLTDSDGNPNDAFATYNLTVDNDVPVTVSSPVASWTTPMMRYNGLQLPPVIKAKRGTTVTVNVTNNLPEITTIHWHGFKIPGAQDGGPDTPIPAGGTKTYSFKIQQAAAPLWFHPHADGFTATQVYAGLAGAFIVTDDIIEQLEASKQLPSGAYDLPLLVQDRSFAPDDGTGVRPLLYGTSPMTAMMGMLGNTVLVNGAILPELAVETRQYRFRVFNGSNARTYDFALSNGSNFNVVATDGGLLPSPVSTDHLVLAAGERAEIVVDFRANVVTDTVSLVNRSTANSEIIRFNVTSAVTDDVTLYASLPDNAEIFQRLGEADATNQRTFVMSISGGMMGAGGMSFQINGKSFDMNRIDEFVTSGATEIWTINNSSMMAHPFHAHAIQWQVLDRDGIPSSGTDLGWKDTVLVQPGQTVRIIGHFDPVINQGLYMYHCHILEHEDGGMMGTFQVQ